MGKRWSTQDIERLRSLAQKRRAVDIAAELGRTRGSLAVKAHQLGISLRVAQKDTPLQSTGAEHRDRSDVMSGP
jgi:hypothetical protein